MHAIGGLGHVREHRGRVEEAGAVRHRAAAFELRPLGQRVETNSATLSRVSALTSGPTSTDGSVPSPTFSARIRSAESLLGEGIGKAVVDVDAVRGRAGLAEVAHLGQHRALDGGVHVGILQDQHGRVAPQLHRRFQDLVGGGFQKLAAHPGGAGEADHPHARVVQHVIDQRAGLLRRQHVDEALGHARLLQKRHQRQHGQRRLRGGLDDHAAARGQRGRDLSRAHGGGVVPRRDQHGEARGLVLHHDARARGGGVGDQAVGAHGLFGEPAEELGGIGRLALRVRARLAVFQRDEMGEMVEPRGHQLPCAAQHLGAFARRPRGPVGHGAFGGIERRVGIRDVGGGDGGEHLLGGGVDDVEAVGALAPFAVDIEVGVVHAPPVRGLSAAAGGALAVTAPEASSSRAGMLLWLRATAFSGFAALMIAITDPTGTACSASARMAATKPSCPASTSITDLSVSTSSRTSLAATGSPGFLRQATIRPLSCAIPSAGMMISAPDGRGSVSNSAREVGSSSCGVELEGEGLVFFAASAVSAITATTWPTGT
jgi:hypothetical protein